MILNVLACLKKLKRGCSNEIIVLYVLETHPLYRCSCFTVYIWKFLFQPCVIRGQQTLKKNSRKKQNSILATLNHIWKYYMYWLNVHQFSLNVTVFFFFLSHLLELCLFVLNSGCLDSESIDFVIKMHLMLNGKCISLFCLYFRKHMKNY